jgi:flagellar basal body rod protein FlgB
MNPALERITDASLRALDQSLMRQQVAAQNIARADEPGFMALRVSSTDATEAPKAEPSDSPVRMDQEVAEMVSASLEYQLLADALSRHLGLARLAISTRS